MLSLFNRYLHGYVAMPTVLACSRRGLFRQIKEAGTSASFDRLVEGRGANPGPLAVAMNMFESLGWVERGEGGYILSSAFPRLEGVSESILRRYEIPVEKVVHEGGKTCMDDFIGLLHLTERSLSKEQDELFSDFLDSTLIIPVLYILNAKTIRENSCITPKEIIKPHWEQLGIFFDLKELGTVQGDCIQLTEWGCFMMDSIVNAGVTLSYRPLLSNMDGLLFGNYLNVTEHYESDEHVDRTMNVVGSGSQHKTFFADFQKLVQSLFSTPGLTRPPAVIADIGCGNGSLLKHCYDAVPDEHQVQLVGVDPSEDAQEETRSTLAGVPHTVMSGDIGAPRKLLSDLSEKGFNDPDAIVHIRSFVDHDRPYIAPSLNGTLDGIKDMMYSGAYVGEGGTLLSPHDVVGSLIEHFQRWADVVGRQGLITLEVFSLPPWIVRKYLDETESLHFDAYHGFSRQLLVEASTYLMAAAQAGLFADKKRFKKYPQLLSYTRISLQHFVKKPFIVRPACPSDHEALLEIEKELDERLQAKPEQIMKRITNDPGGQYILEKNGHVIGVLYTQRIESEDEICRMRYDDVESFHRRMGSICQLISLHIRRSEQGQDLGGDLLRFGLLNSFVKSGVKKIVGISRCARFKSSSLPHREYIHQKNSLGYLADPILDMHYEEGANVVDVVPGYRPSDEDNDGHGVHICYTYMNWIRKA